MAEAFAFTAVGLRGTSKKATAEDTPTAREGYQREKPWQTQRVGCKGTRAQSPGQQPTGDTNGINPGQNK